MRVVRTLSFGRYPRLDSFRAAVKVARFAPLATLEFAKTSLTVDMTSRSWDPGRRPLWTLCPWVHSLHPGFLGSRGLSSEYFWHEQVLPPFNGKVHGPDPSSTTTPGSPIDIPADCAGGTYFGAVSVCDIVPCWGFIFGALGVILFLLAIFGGVLWK